MQSVLHRRGFSPPPCHYRPGTSGMEPPSNNQGDACGEFRRPSQLRWLVRSRLPNPPYRYPSERVASGSRFLAEVVSRRLRCRAESFLQSLLHRRGFSPPPCQYMLARIVGACAPRPKGRPQGAHRKKHIFASRAAARPSYIVIKISKQLLPQSIPSKRAILKSN